MCDSQFPRDILFAETPMHNRGAVAPASVERQNVAGDFSHTNSYLKISPASRDKVPGLDIDFDFACRSGGGRYFLVPFTLKISPDYRGFPYNIKTFPAWRRGFSTRPTHPWTMFID
jgi:hypothetical protein